MVKVSKKAQGMPINVIIIAALALMVLVVVVVIFSGRVRIFSQNLESCTAKQGQCEKGPICLNNKALITNTDCDTKRPKEICCVEVFNT